ncbi:MAG: glycine-rich protein, partial [Bacteroidales bacterium]|nr:glycine-rich protein [Bacteroidales bacterium]
MVKIFTKSVCMALFFALCSWNLIAQNEIIRAEQGETEQNVSPTFNFDFTQPGVRPDGVKYAEPLAPRESSREARSNAFKRGENPTVSPREALPADRDEQESPQEHGRTSFSLETGDGPMRGPTTTAYIYDGEYAQFAKMPLNTGVFSHLSTPCYDYMTAADWINGKWYAVNYYDNYIYEVNTTTGTRTIVSGHYADYPVGMAYNPVDGYIYIVSENGYAYRGSITSGVYNWVGYIPWTSGISGYGGPIAFTNEGRCIMVDTYDYGIVTELNFNTGTATIITALIDVWMGGIWQDIAIDRETNTIYWIANGYYYGDGGIYRVDIECGKLKKVADIPYYSWAMGFAIPTMMSSSDTKNFAFTGVMQEVYLPKAGTYQIECWGADGGGQYGGKGGYSKGNYTVTAPTTLYIYVGGKGGYTGVGQGLGGWNGGGNSGMHSSATTMGGGGGGTDIRTTQN